MVLGCAFMVFSGVIVLVHLREVGFVLSLLLWAGGWGVCGLRVGVGGASLSRGVLSTFLLEGSRMGFLCLLKGGHGGRLLETTVYVPCELKASRGL